jgi:hypothetical protein
MPPNSSVSTYAASCSPTSGCFWTSLSRGEANGFLFDIYLVALAIEHGLLGFGHGLREPLLLLFGMMMSDGRRSLFFGGSKDFLGRK